MTPQIRIQDCNDLPINPDGEFVLYWMTAFRRVQYNFSLDRAVEWASQLNKPLVILEPLRCDYRWASDRIHQFVIDGLVENEAQLEPYPVTYYPYLESQSGESRGMLKAFSQHACVIVTDDFPSFFLPRMVEAASKQVAVKMEKVDSNGLLPLRATSKVFSKAFHFRQFLQKNLATHLEIFPSPIALEGARLPRLQALPFALAQRWPKTELPLDVDALKNLPIDHNVPPTTQSGGSLAAEEKLHAFLAYRLSDYSELRNQPEQSVTSQLSAYLHFGHISTHQIFRELAEQEQWSLGSLSDKTKGQREGWWGMSPTAESFLDELITWREVGFNMSSKQANYDQYESLPDWAKKTLAEHADDPREHLYSLEEFEQAQTHDPLWNAAQTQLVQEGTIHNYLRMLWGKKILEWSPTPQDALAVMIELNNKYALDGRNPNSYSGIFWCLGRYDRAWGPERPIYGKIRYMSSDNTARKVKVKHYIETYSLPSKELSLFT